MIGVLHDEPAGLWASVTPLLVKLFRIMVVTERVSRSSRHFSPQNTKDALKSNDTCVSVCYRDGFLSRMLIKR